MALIEKKLVTERETVSYKLDRKTIELIRHYSEFIGSPQEHVVNEALLFIFRKDRDFNEWLAAHHKDVDPTVIPTERQALSIKSSPKAIKA